MPKVSVDAELNPFVKKYMEQRKAMLQTSQEQKRKFEGENRYIQSSIKWGLGSDCKYSQVHMARGGRQTEAIGQCEKGIQVGFFTPHTPLF